MKAGRPYQEVPYVVKVVLVRSTNGLVTLVIMNYVTPAESGYLVITMGTVFCVLVTTYFNV